MRRRVAFEAATADPNPQRDALLDAVKLLMPLRELRKHNLLRRHREAQQQLEQMKTAIEQVQQQCCDDLQQQRHERQALATQHQHRTLSLKAITQWQAQEQQLLERHDELRQHLQRLQLERDEQQRLSEQAAADLREGLRALEKLTCLRDTLE